MKLNDANGPGRESALPPIADLARQIREGTTVDDLCKTYRISRSTLQNRFQFAGYSLATGEQHEPRHARPAPLQSQHVGAGGQHVGGGDYQGLPTTPVKYRDKPSRTGIDWDQVRDNYLANGGQLDDSVWHQGKVVVIGSNSARSSRANIHSFEEVSDYTEPATEPQPKPKRTRARKKTETATSVLPRIYQVQPEQRPEIRRRYEQDLESVPVLARAYDVSEGSIQYAIKAAGGRLRSKKEAAALNRDRAAAS